jgi:3-hydroxymyristoyl/3-hydroxydecanoyl-(acyl carrier protein) dehydratase
VFEIEMLFQAAQLLLMLDGDADSTEEIDLVSVDNARFTSPIVPPKKLVITVEVISRRESLVSFSGFVEDGAERFIQTLFSVMSSKI